MNACFIYSTVNVFGGICSMNKSNKSVPAYGGIILEIKLVPVVYS